jgi:hypothetical protein
MTRNYKFAIRFGRIASLVKAGDDVKHYHALLTANILQLGSDLSSGLMSAKTCHRPLANLARKLHFLQSESNQEPLSVIRRRKHIIRDYKGCQTLEPLYKQLEARKPKTHNPDCNIFNVPSN